MKILSSLQNDELDLKTQFNFNQDLSELEKIKEFKETIENEIITYANDIQDVIDLILPFCHTHESFVFFHKLKGDNYRYCCELTVEKQNYIDKSLSEYTKALETSEKYLTRNHPTSLALSLNYSIFLYEVMNSREKACQLAKLAFDLAVTDLDTLSNDLYRESTYILQLLRDNLTFWNSDTKTEE